MAFCETCKERLKSKLATATTESARLVQLFNSMCAELVVLREKLLAKDSVVTYIVEDLCATLGPSLMGLLDLFCYSLSRSVSEAFRSGFIDF